MPTPALPWILLRKGKPRVPFATRELGIRFFDHLRRNGSHQPDAALVGPNGEAWYCRGNRWSEWFRDDARRKRELPADDTADDPAETSA